MALKPKPQPRPKAQAQPALEGAAPKATPPAPPAWLVPAYLASLVFVLVGERVLATTQTPRNVATGLGVAGALGTVALMARVALSARAVGGAAARERASIYTLLAGLGVLGLASIGCALALTETGLRTLGAATMTPEARARLVGVLRALVVLTAGGSALPLVFGDRALAPMRHAPHFGPHQRPEPPHFEARRVRAAIVSGATLALAAAYCSLFVLSSGAIEQKLDFSHFRTGRPSDSTKNVAKSLTEPVRVLSFFPPSSEIGAEVRGYLRELAGASGGKLELELYDRLLEPGLARDAKVTQDGVVVLLRGAQREAVTVGNDPKTAPNKLKNLDQDVQKALIKVLRSQRTAYFTVGHGEVNEAASREAAEGRSVKTLRRILESQNYLVKDLGLAQGLGSELPKDAYVVFVLGPQKALMPEELSALGAFVRRGGKLFLALDPEAKAEHGPLAGVLGLTWSGVPLAHDKIYAARRRTAADKGILVTTRFSSHASVSTLSRNAQKAPLIFPGVTSLDKAEGATGKIDFIVKSMPDTFEDGNQSYEPDQGEKRAVFNLAAAVTLEGAGADKQRRRRQGRQGRARGPRHRGGRRRRGDRRRVRQRSQPGVRARLDPLARRRRELRRRRGQRRGRGHRAHQAERPALVLRSHLRGAGHRARRGPLVRPPQHAPPRRRAARLAWACAWAWAWAWALAGLEGWQGPEGLEARETTQAREARESRRGRRRRGRRA
jgi:hypothetical protein